MTKPLTSTEQRREVERQVDRMLARSASYNALPPEEQRRIRDDTAAVVETMAQNRLRQTAESVQGSADPFAVPMFEQSNINPLQGITGQGGGNGQQRAPFTGGATQPGQRANFGPTELTDFGAGIAMGVSQTGQLLREVNFPNFVAELVQGVFQAVVDASIQQMKAYGELVQSVTMSLNDFRDQNVSPNQGRDHLVSKYPTLMQVNITDSGPKVGPKPGWDDADLPDFKGDLGLDTDISDLDEETIEEYLVPAARNDLAKQRQSLLATMVLMGINRIIVTDGKINAKLKFDFRARDSQSTFAQKWDHENMGDITVKQSEYDRGEETGPEYKEQRSHYASSDSRWRSGYANRSGESSRWSKGSEQTTTAPMIVLQSQTTTQTDAEVAAEGQLRGEVSLNFKSETFPLDQLASADEIFKLERVRTAGRGAAAPAGQAAPAGTGTAPAGTTPAQTPAQTPAPAAG